MEGRNRAENLLKKVFGVEVGLASPRVHLSPPRTASPHIARSLEPPEQLESLERLEPLEQLAPPPETQNHVLEHKPANFPSQPLLISPETPNFAKHAPKRRERAKLFSAL